MITYVLADPDTGEIRYVGRTSVTLESRMKGHLRERTKFSDRECNIGAWVGRLAADGKKPFPIMVAAYDCEWEVHKSLRARGARLVNGHTPPHPRTRKTLAMLGAIGGHSMPELTQ